MKNIDKKVCLKKLLAIRDTMDILGGKWKIPILGALGQSEMRFSELKEHIDGITSKMLSQELQDLELNKLVLRTVNNTRPITVHYTLTEYGKTLGGLIEQIYIWGAAHREKMFAAEEVTQN
jgi:DNA-binding HxlR family transcriptional regulator